MIDSSIIDDFIFLFFFFYRSLFQDHSMSSSIEDFYIDDDNLELMNLNINMLLLDDEMYYDNNYLFGKQTN